jgi:hypothetical protein
LDGKRKAEDTTDTPSEKKQCAEDRDDLEKLEGVVQVADTVFYVCADKNEKKYVFDNQRTHNPYRGLGSMSKTSIVLKDDSNASWKPSEDPEKEVVPDGKTLAKILTSTGEVGWDNTTDYTHVGPILRPGARVKFVAPSTAKLLTVPGTEDVAMFVKDSYSVFVGRLAVPDGFDGIAADVQPM